MEVERSIEEYDMEAVRRLAGALQIDPSTAEAHDALAERYGTEHVEAESARDGRRASRVAAVLRTHAERALPATAARWGTYLQGDGALTLVTDPPGAEALLHRFVVQNRRLVPIFERSLGATPLRAVPLAMGSYLCVLRHAGRAEVRYPVNIASGQHWDGVAPGEREPRAIPLPLASELGPDDCYVAPAWFGSGGDLEAADPMPRRRLWCEGRVFRRFSVTNREYMAFLDDLVATGREEEALALAPQEPGGTRGVAGPMMYGRDGGGGASCCRRTRRGTCGCPRGR